jgi:anaerobic selenocysteine-containing dehydrogenase
MSDWQKTSCVLCAQNCGLEVIVEENRITRVRPDKANFRSAGYACRKGLNVAHHQHNADRLTHPLKKVGDKFERVSWDQALIEIAARLKEIIAAHGPRSLAYMGGGGQGCHFEAAFGVRLLRGLGSRYHYSALGQELTGAFWVMGRTLGRQYIHTIPDLEHTDVLVALGWNGWMSHQVPQARRHLSRISRDPDKKLLVIDPRRSETARRADLHLALRPGTDALLLKAVIGAIIKNGWHNMEYLNRHVSGFDAIQPLFENIDLAATARVCELDEKQIVDLARLLAESAWCWHSDLGVLMNRHSTATTWLEMILAAVCGRIGVKGGNIIPGHLMPLGSHSDEREERTWRTVTTDYPAIMGVFPPAVVPEEILADHPERLRAMICSGANPLRSYPDTTQYEKAYQALDLSVTIEIVMSETARLSDYVLPARTGFESWDASFFAWTHPEIFFQMRRPVVQPQGECLENGEFFVKLADHLGLIPDIPQSLYEAAKGDRLSFGMALMQFAGTLPNAAEVLPFVLAKTLGQELGSMHLAACWGLLMNATGSFRKNAARAGFDTGPMMGEEMFRQLLDHPEGIIIGRMDEDEPFGDLKTPDKKINLAIDELSGWVESITPESETKNLALPAEYPYLLMAGRHHDTNANTLMRDPAWNQGRRAGTILIHPDDAGSLGLADGDLVRVTTAAGQEEAEAEVTTDNRPGHVVIPHGFGLVYDGRKNGPNVNRLTPNTLRDRLAGTPLHRYVPCRLERV